MDKTNKMYLYKYFYVLIIFLGIISLPFLFMKFETEYQEVVSEYNEVVLFAAEEGFDIVLRDDILNLYAKVEDAKLVKNYKSYVSLSIVIIFLLLFNYFYIRLGYKLNIFTISESSKLNKKLLIVLTFFEIIYFVCLLIFSDYLFIGTHYWTLFLVNIVLIILIIVITLQIEYFIKNKSEE